METKTTHRGASEAVSQSSAGPSSGRPAAWIGAGGFARSTIWRGILVLALAVYLGAATYQLLLPGLNSDEALDAVPAMNFVLDQPIEAASTVQIGGRTWPLMIMPYIGPTSSLLMIPAFSLAGVSALTLRWTTVLLGAFTLLLMWGFLREYLDERAAALAVLLLAVDPTFVFFQRMGEFVAQPMLPIFVAALWCFFKWYRGRKLAFLILAAFFMGFGLSTKLLFLWAWAALSVAWLLLSPWIGEEMGWRRWLWPLRRVRARHLPLVGLAVIIGSGIVLWYNLDGVKSLAFFMNSIWARPGGGGLDILANLQRVGLGDFRMLMDGSWFVGKIGRPPINQLAMPALLVSLATIGILAAAGRLRYSLKRLALLVILTCCFVVFGAAAEVSHGANHLILVWPAPQALMAVAFLGAFDALTTPALRHRGAPIAVVAIAAACVFGAEAWTSYAFHLAAAQTGGRGHYSDAIYDLAQDLERPGAPPAMLFDWGFLRNLEVITANRIQLREVFTYETPPNPVFREFLEDIMANPTALYVFHTPGWTAFPGHWELFERAAYGRRLEPVLWKTYTQRDGEPVYLVYKLAPIEPLDALPAGARRLVVQGSGGLSLAGYSLPEGSSRIGDVLRATLYWQAAQPQQTNYKVFAHLLGDNGKLWSSHDSIPGDWGYPTTSWRPGEVVADRLWLPVSEDTPPGTYHLFVGMYDPVTGERLPLSRDGERLKGDTVEIGTVQLSR